MKELRSSKEFDIRFSEVDSMGVVWHGSYTLYLEDARETFGAEYGLGYLTLSSKGFYVPLVELSFQYKKPMIYGTAPRIDIIYRPSQSAKIIFDYEIYDTLDNSLIATAHSVQVFVNKDYELQWIVPGFYHEWQEKWGQIE